MGKTDRLYSIIIIAYLLWVCYYRLFGDSSCLIHTQLYFSFESLSAAVLFGRLYISDKYPIVLKTTRNITLIGFIFKIFQFSYTALSYTKMWDLYLVRNHNIIWLVIGVLLILALLVIFVYKEFKK